MTRHRAFTYTPPTLQRQAVTDTTTTDTLTITADNGVRTTTETVTVTVDPGVPTAGPVTVGDPDTTTGQVSGALVFTDTRTRR